MSNFKVGQKVVCVDPTRFLKINEIYTINGISMCCCGDISVSIVEYQIPRNTLGTICGCGYKVHGNGNLFYSSRFRPLHHEFAEEVISMLLEQPETVEVCAV